MDTTSQQFLSFKAECKKCLPCAITDSLINHSARTEACINQECLELMDQAGVGWDLIGYPGIRVAVAEDEQRMGARS